MIEQYVLSTERKKDDFKENDKYSISICRHIQGVPAPVRNMIQSGGSFAVVLEQDRADGLSLVQLARMLDVELFQRAFDLQLQSHRVPDLTALSFAVGCSRSLEFFPFLQQVGFTLGERDRQPVGHKPPGVAAGHYGGGRHGS